MTPRQLTAMMEQVIEQEARRGIDVDSMQLKFKDEDGLLHSIDGFDFEEEPDRGAPYFFLEGEAE